jgi:hypothetical protein
MIKGIVKRKTKLYNGNIYRQQITEKLLTGEHVEIESEIEIEAGEYELERVENPWFPREYIGEYPGDWLVIKGTKTGLNERLWNLSDVFRIFVTED